jgi:hypothetical protein
MRFGFGSQDAPCLHCPNAVFAWAAHTLTIPRRGAAGLAYLVRLSGMSPAIGSGHHLLRSAFLWPRSLVARHSLDAQRAHRPAHSWLALRSTYPIMPRSGSHVFVRVKPEFAVATRSS